MRFSISSNFKNLSINHVKYVFHWEKLNFEPTGNFEHTTEFLILGKALLMLLLLYLQMLIVQISTQTVKQEHSEKVNIKKHNLELKSQIQQITQNSISLFL